MGLRAVSRVGGWKTEVGISESRDTPVERRGEASGKGEGGRNIQKLNKRRATETR